MVASQQHANDAEGRYVDAEGIRFACRFFGAASGTPLAFLQRFRGTMDHWDPALVDAIGRERPIVLFDNAGIGLQTAADAGRDSTRKGRPVRLRHECAACGLLPI